MDLEGVFFDSKGTLLHSSSKSRGRVPSGSYVPDAFNIFSVIHYMASRFPQTSYIPVCSNRSML